MGRSLRGCSRYWRVDVPRIHVSQLVCVDRLYMAARSSGMCTDSELACHLHDLSAILLCSEEAKHIPPKAAVESAISTICCLDDSYRPDDHPTYRWVYHFHSSPVSSRWKLLVSHSKSSKKKKKFLAGPPRPLFPRISILAYLPRYISAIKSGFGQR